MTPQMERLVREAREQGIRRHVVGALAMRDGQVLLLRRPPHDFMGGIYELPSGEVAEGEGLAEALERETLEETGCPVARILGHVGSFDYASKSGRPTRQFTFAVELAAGDAIRLSEHDAYAWVAEAEVGGYEVTEPIRKLLRRAWTAGGAEGDPPR